MGTDSQNKECLMKDEFYFFLEISKFYILNITCSSDSYGNFIVDGNFLNVPLVGHTVTTKEGT